MLMLGVVLAHLGGSALFTIYNGVCAMWQATVDLAAMDIHSISYLESAKRMRTLLQTGLLRHTDLNDNPERFFLAHRLLARLYVYFVIPVPFCVNESALSQAACVAI